MIQQVDTELHQHLQGVERTVCLALHQGAQAQEDHYMLDEHQAMGGGDVEVLYHPL